MGNKGSCSHVAKPLLVLMDEFLTSNTLDYFDGLPLNMAGRSVPTGYSKISTELIWHLGTSSTQENLLSKHFRYGFRERKRISCHLKIV